MISRWNFAESIPPDGIYKGSTRVWFQTPDGEVSGPATVNLSPNGHVFIKIEIEQFSIPAEYRTFLMPFLKGHLPEPIAGGGTTFRDRGTQVIARVEVQTANGQFLGTRAFMSASHFNFPNNAKSSITIVANDLEFVAGKQDLEEIWCAPLFGNLGVFGGAETAWSIGDQGPYIAFQAYENSCGLEMYNSAETSPYTNFSAVVFGSIGNRPHASIKEIRHLIPDGLASALSFAAGSDIGAPWIDLRSFDGRLQRRIHVRFGMDQRPDGSPAFTRFDSTRPGSGIGPFLDCYFSLPKDHWSLIAPMNLVRSGAPGSDTVDESITDLVKALDAICKAHGVSSQDLTTKLDCQNAAAVGEIIRDAREKLKNLRTQCKIDQKLGELEVFDRIISRQANVASKESAFGLAVADLLVKLGFFDAEVMSKYYSQLPGDVTWEGLLSAIRGQVIHSGAIHTQKSGSLLPWFEFARHLHDICKRVILRAIRYTGTYCASNVRYKGQYELDRITPSTTISELGYTAPPVSI